MKVLHTVHSTKSKTTVSLMAMPHHGRSLDGMPQQKRTEPLLVLSSTESRGWEPWPLSRARRPSQNSAGISAVSTGVSAVSPGGDGEAGGADEWSANSCGWDS